MRNIVILFGAIALYLLLLIEWHLRLLAKRIDQAQRYLEQIVDLMRLQRFRSPSDDEPVVVLPDDARPVSERDGA